MTALWRRILELVAAGTARSRGRRRALASRRAARGAEDGGRPRRASRRAGRRSPRSAAWRRRASEIAEGRTRVCARSTGARGQVRGARAAALAGRHAAVDRDDGRGHRRQRACSSRWSTASSCARCPIRRPIASSASSTPIRRPASSAPGVASGNIDDWRRARRRLRRHRRLLRHGPDDQRRRRRRCAHHRAGERRLLRRCCGVRPVAGPPVHRGRNPPRRLQLRGGARRRRSRGDVVSRRVGAALRRRSRAWSAAPSSSNGGPFRWSASCPTGFAMPDAQRSALDSVEHLRESAARSAFPRRRRPAQARRLARTGRRRC